MSDAFPDEPRAYFARVDTDRYRPTSHAGGAWNPGEIHFSPLGGLLVHAIDLHRQGSPDDAKQLGRITFDILGFLADAECTVTVSTIRPGRTIELVEATAVIGGRPVAVARAWFLVEVNTAEVAGGVAARLPHPEDAQPRDLREVWNGGYIGSLEGRSVRPPEPGRTTAWIRSTVDLVAGEDASPHARFIALVDTANGIAVRRSPKEWMFPNVDLTIHLFREPAGEWVGLDTTVTFGATGLGLTSTVLHDTDGPLGVGAQALTVRPLG